MNLVEYLAAHPEVVSQTITEPLTSGVEVTGVPAQWVRVDRVGEGPPGAAWIDATVIDDAEAAAGSRVFASLANVFGWVLTGTDLSVTELVDEAAATTADTTGWEGRGLVARESGPRFASVRQLGTLASPFGPLISNAQSMAAPLSDDSIVLVQLIVTATQKWSGVANAIALHRVQGGATSGAEATESRSPQGASISATAGGDPPIDVVVSSNVSAAEQGQQIEQDRWRWLTR
ncbi:hypothetical protein HUN08_17770 [Gordonia sp. X0973]|uniref:hypothetical protein n=1 Tax=Gordonia sp. X0973 TaxID=2742602 RepID=UPI000F52ECE7|nr:hypothetical protein [Gordonia sp. X0973]QKT08850.1 hypothetical protein HUN08_17770 [Gordonia sp. X0973]